MCCMHSPNFAVMYQRKAEIMIENFCGMWEKLLIIRLNTKQLSAECMHAHHYSYIL